MSHSGALARINTFLDGIIAEGNVLRALMLRELQTRYGRHNIGFLWVIAEPLMFASVITGLHAVSPMGTHIPGFSPYTFTLTGYTLFIIFRNSYNRAESAIHGTLSLLYHNMIKPFDIMVSKSVIETISVIAALGILQGIGIAIGQSALPARPLYLFLAIGLITWFTFALALLIAAYTYDNHVLSRLVHPSSYFAVPLSGAFVTMSFLPVWARPAMAWNPMMGIFETARYGQFESAPSDYTNIGYVIAVCTGLTYWGLIAIRRLRSKIHLF